MPSYELSFPVNAGSPKGLNDISDAIKTIADRTRISSGELKTWKQYVDQGVQSGLSLNRSLQQAEAGFKSAGGALGVFTIALKDEISESTRAATAAQRLGAAHGQMVPQVAAASAALRTMEGAMPLRAAERFLTTMTGMGPLLQKAFPIFGAIAFGEVLVTMIEKFENWRLGLERIKELNETIGKTNREQNEEAVRFRKNAIETRLAIIGVTQGAGAEESARSAKIAKDLSEHQAGLQQQLAVISSIQAKIREARTAPSYTEERVGKGGAIYSVEGKGHSTYDPARMTQLSDVDLPQALGSAEVLRARIADEQALLQLHRAKSGKDVEPTQNRVDAIIKRLNEQGLDPLSKLIHAMADDIADLQATRHETRAQIAAIRGAYGGRILEVESGMLASGIGRRAAAIPQQDTTWGAIYGLPSGMELSERWRQEQMRQRQGITGFSLPIEEPYSSESDRSVTGVRNLAQSGAARSYAYQAKLVQLMTGPGGELDAINKVSALREAAARREFDLSRRTTEDKFKMEEELFRAREDHAIQIAELEKRRIDNIRGITAGLIHTAITNPGGFASSLTGTLRDAALKPIETGLANTVAGPLHSMIYGQGGKGGINGMLGGIFGNGQDPVKVSTDANTIATVANTNAVAAMAAALGVPMSALPASGGGGGGVGFSMPSFAGIGGGLGGLTALFSKNAWTGGTFHDPVGGVSSLPANVNDLGKTDWHSMIGGGMMGVAGTLAAINGFSHGGARGALQGAGGIATAAAGILPLLSKSLTALGPIGMAAGMALSMASMFIGDPKQNQITRQLRGATFYDPVAINETVGSNGMYSDYDRYGNVRSSNLSPVPSILEPYSDFRRGVMVPGQTGSYFGGSGPNTVPIIINAMDGASVERVLMNNPQSVAGATQLALSQGHQGLTEAIRANV